MGEQQGSGDRAERRQRPQRHDHCDNDGTGRAQQETPFISVAGGVHLGFAIRREQHHDQTGRRCRRRQHRCWPSTAVAHLGGQRPQLNRSGCGHGNTHHRQRARAWQQQSDQHHGEHRPNANAHRGAPGSLRRIQNARQRSAGGRRECHNNPGEHRNSPKSRPVGAPLRVSSPRHRRITTPVRRRGPCARRS